jgi:hypothetical protein
MQDIQIIKSNGEVEVFDDQKLITSLIKARATDEEISQVVKKVKSKLKQNMTTSDVYALAFKTLNSIQKYNPNAIRYGIKRSIMNLGPTGFPFEVFIGRIFEKLGYKVITGTMVKGNCIEHEVDIVAYNQEEVICVEAKFHNEPHLKSDTKVALYVKARFDDLIGQFINLEEKKYIPIKKGILITNTTFTDTAHFYVDCVGTFELISWNKPEDKNLMNYIEEYNLYPVTVVPGLHKKEIDYLISQNILTCNELKDNLHLLDDLHVHKNKKEILKGLLEHICNC